MIHFITGKGGTGKSHKLISILNSLIDENVKNDCEFLNKKIYVIVPEQFSFEFDKKLYSTLDETLPTDDYSNDTPFAPNYIDSLGAYKYNQIKVTKFSKLSKQIMKEYGSASKDYINELSKIIAMYQAIRNLNSRHSLIALEHQTKNSGFIDQALRQVAELKKSGINSDKLLEVSNDFPPTLKDKVNDVSLIFAEYENILKQKHLQDTLSDIIVCNDLAKKKNYFDNATIFIDEFDAFTNDELQLIKTMFSQCKDFYVSLRTDNPNNVHPSQFDAVNKTYRQLISLINEVKKELPLKDFNINTINLNIGNTPHRYENSRDLEVISQNILINNTTDKPKCLGDISIIKCNDHYQECDYVCSQIRKLIIHGDGERKYSYNDIFVTARHIDDYLGIMERAFQKYDIPYFLSTDKASIYTYMMVYFTNLLEILASKKFDTDTVLRYIKNPINAISFKDIADLEEYCYKWNVKDKMWEEPFLEQSNGNSNIDSTRLNVIMPLIKLKESVQNKTCIEICNSIFNFIEEQSIRKNIQTIIDNNRANHNNTDADEIVRMWDTLMTILDTLCKFMGNEPISITDFKDVVCAMISQSKFKIAPQKLDAVSFSASDNARFNSPKVIFVLGVNDGVFPANVSTNGIFTQSDMKHFADIKLEFSKSLEDKTADEKLVVYKTLSAPSEKLYLSYALSNNSGDKKYPSYVIDSIISLFEKNSLAIQDANDLPIQDICSTFKSSYEFYVKNFHLRDTSSDVKLIKSILNTNNEYSNRLEYLEKVSNNTQFKLQDRRVSERLFGTRFKISATDFENFNNCHFMYFCSKGLNIYKPQKVEISDLNIGNIIHYCLEKVLKNNPKDVFVKLSKSDIQCQVEKFAFEFKERQLGGNYGKTERFNANYNRVKNSIFQTLEHIQKEFKQLEFTAKDFELRINNDITNGDIGNNSNPLVVKAENGVEVLLHGKIDRVDIFTDTHGKSYVRIIDYKSGNKSSNPFERNRLPYGINMQMFLYLFAITSENGKYSKCIPAGVLYMPINEIIIPKDNERSNPKYSSEEATDMYFKMKGMLLNNEEVLKAMQNDLKEVFIPCSSNNSLLTETQFENIRKYAINLLKNMANSIITNGDISARTLIIGTESNNNSSCNYCDYWSICGKYPNLDCNRIITDDANNEYLKIINNSDEDNKGSEM